MTATATVAAVPRCLDLLVLEDRVADAELIVAQLRRDGFAPSWTRVDTEAAFVAALRPTLDLILADYLLPQFTARRALEILAERGLDVPVIVVTGAVGEDLAVECVRAGASDYLLKDRLARLGAAVVRTLADHAAAFEKRRVERALVDSERRYRRLFECALDAILIAEAKTGAIVDANASASEMFGFTRDGGIGRTLQEIGLLAEPGRMQQVLQALATGKYVRDVAMQVDTPHGPVDVELMAVLYSVGEQSLIQCNVRSIWDRLQVDRERLEFVRRLSRGGGVESSRGGAGVSVYFEIQADNVPRAVEFYRRVFGWTLAKQDGLPIEYWRIESPHGRGGVLQRPVPAPKGAAGTNAFVCSIEVSDFDAAAGKILAGGGQVALPKFAVPGVCWHGYFVDPEGNTFGIFQPDPTAR